MKYLGSAVREVNGGTVEVSYEIYGKAGSIREFCWKMCYTNDGGAFETIYGFCNENGKIQAGKFYSHPFCTKDNLLNTSNPPDWYLVEYAQRTDVVAQCLWQVIENYECEFFHVRYAVPDPGEPFDEMERQFFQEMESNVKQAKQDERTGKKVWRKPVSTLEYIRSGGKNNG